MSTPPRGRADYLELGSWNAICAECGRKRKASDMKKLPIGVPGAGMYVCEEHWNPRQPQDYVKGMPDNPTTPWVQLPPDTYSAFCTPNGTSAVPGQAVPGCFFPSYLSPSYNPDAPE